MVNSGLWLTEEGLLWPVLFGPDAQLRFLAAHGTCTHSSDLTSKSPNNLKHLSSNTCAASVWIPHHYRSLGQALVGATDNPIEFLWKPGRSLTQPLWLNSSACA